MLNASKIGNSVHVTYHSQNFQSGVVCTVEVLDPTNVAVAGSPFTMVEIPSTGVYQANFTPSMLGVYNIIVQEAGNSKAHTQIQIQNSDIDSVAAAISGILPPSTQSGGRILNR